MNGDFGTIHIELPGGINPENAQALFDTVSKVAGRYDEELFVSMHTDGPCEDSPHCFGAYLRKHGIQPEAVAPDRIKQMIEDPEYFTNARERRLNQALAERRRERRSNRKPPRKWIPPFGTKRLNRMYAEAERYLDTHWVPFSIREDRSHGKRWAFIYGYTAAKGWDK